ncbi:MocR-like pyridoxine biosynthesis transcription factor PdxR [Saccharibacillus endophyticus]|uniref:GntR family transcriptional regulator n=1 Tax=Saccharibacillus endophyticus TaxID=2060666 RepID=A0ABQ1ZN36_9BACL|nr:PLP-dependent aminotransferase family protein [Saccharibacillus endophyticus]GGH69763.1 GntR family transcriptional regulator [Saccharibacillus endophyticus]
MLELTPLLTSNPDGIWDSHRKEPIYEQLYSYLRIEIRAGRISSGSKLPSQRRLAGHLHVSRNTVDAAYQQLLAEGYVHSEPRRGLFVSELPESEEALKRDRSQLNKDEPTNLINGKNPWDSDDSDLDGGAELESLNAANEPLYDFRYGDVDTQHFPYRLWRQFLMKSLSPEHARLLQYGDPQGEIELRQQIAEYLYQSRGVRCSPGQIVIGAGTQWLMDLLCRLIGREARYAMEEPGYPRMRMIFEECGRAPVAVKLDESGIRVSELGQHEVQAVYITPSHQFPTGTVMSVSRRLELIEWARAAGGTIIEDDYDSEFRYEGRPIPSLHSLDKHGNTVYVGTFSKSLMPSARIGYLVLPDKLMPAYRTRGQHYKQTTSRLDQYTLALFMQSGEWARHLNRMRNLYKKRYSALVAAIRTYMDQKVRIIGAAAGLHLLLKPNNGMTEQESIGAAEKWGVRVYPAADCYIDPSDVSSPVKTQVLLGYAGLNEAAIEEGVKRLAIAWGIARI